MDIFSILFFLIYSLVILGIIIYVSPLISAVIMIIVPLVFVLILPDQATVFFSTLQFTYSGVQVFNLHILLIVWSAFIGIITYAEVVTWYLLKETEQAKTKEVKPIQGEKPGKPMAKVKDFLQKLIKILKGEKIKTKP